MPKDKITFPELDAMSMRADESHDTFDLMAKEAFEQWQSELPEEFRMQYVPLFGEGFTAGWEAATHHIEYESRDSKLGKIKACLNYFELKNLTIDDAERFWNAAIFNAIDRLNEKAGDGNGDVSGD